MPDEMGEPLFRLDIGVTNVVRSCTLHDPGTVHITSPGPQTARWRSRLASQRPLVPLADCPTIAMVGRWGTSGQLAAFLTSRAVLALMAVAHLIRE